MNTKDEPRPIGAVVAGSVALIVLLIVVGLWVQYAVISTPLAPPATKPSRRPAGAGAVRQTEASVNVPAALGSDASCRKVPEAQYFRTASVCREVVVADIPAGSQIRTVKPYVKEPGTAVWRPCESRGEGPFMSCRIDGFRFLSLTPAIDTGPSEMTVTWIAMNSSTERSRDAQLLVEFEPPQPPAK